MSLSTLPGLLNKILQWQKSNGKRYGKQISEISFQNQILLACISEAFQARKKMTEGAGYNIASFYINKNTENVIITCASSDEGSLMRYLNGKWIVCNSDSKMHSEAACLSIIEQYYKGYQIKGVYTDREPCGKGAGSKNCTQLLKDKSISENDVIYILPYPDKETVKDYSKLTETSLQLALNYIRNETNTAIKEFDEKLKNATINSITILSFIQNFQYQKTYLDTLPNLGGSGFNVGNMNFTPSTNFNPNSNQGGMFLKFKIDIKKKKNK